MSTTVAQPPGDEMVPLPEPMTSIGMQESRNLAIAELTKSAMSKAGTLQLTKEESDALRADFPDDVFRTGANGNEKLIYIEHAALRDRLNAVLGLGQWAMIPRDIWTEDYSTKGGKDAVRVYSRVMLIVRGCYVGEAIGEMPYYPHNLDTNKADAIEGSKSAAFRRCCKEFGIGLQAWKKVSTDEWWARRNGKQHGAGGVLNAAQVKEINDLLAECADANRPIEYKKFLAWLEPTAGDLSDVPQRRLDLALDYLTKKLKGGAK